MIPEGFIELHKGTNVATADAWLIRLGAIREVVVKRMGKKITVEVNGEAVTEDYETVKRRLAGLPDQPAFVPDSADASDRFLAGLPAAVTIDDLLNSSR